MKPIRGPTTKGYLSCDLKIVYNGAFDKRRSTAAFSSSAQKHRHFMSCTENSRKTCDIVFFPGLFRKQNLFTMSKNHALMSDIQFGNMGSSLLRSSINRSQGRPRLPCKCGYNVVPLRQYSSGSDSADNEALKEDKVSDSMERQENNKMEDIGSHPEVKELLKDIMKDFKDEYGFESEDLDSNDGAVSESRTEGGELQSSSESASSSDSESDNEAGITENLQKALNVHEW